MYSSEDLELLLSSTFLRDIEFHEVIGSTNDRALELSCREELECPFLVLAETSTASRGRENRKWFSPAGAVNLTLIVDSDEYGLAADRNPVISLLIALSVAETIETFVAGKDTQLKWPNDVYVAGKKISGILIERPTQSQHRTAIGIGINVNNSFDSASVELREKATSIVDLTGEENRLSSVIVELLKRIAENFQNFKLGQLDLVQAWQRFCYLTGKSITLTDGARTISGVCQGIDASGALKVRTEEGKTLDVISGSIESIRVISNREL